MTTTLDALQLALRKRDSKEKCAIHFANNTVRAKSGCDLCHDKQQDEPSGFMFYVRDFQIHVEKKYVKKDGSLKKRGVELIRKFKELIATPDMVDALA